MNSESSLQLENLKQHIHAALRAWHSANSTPDNLLASLLLVQLKRQNLNLDDNPTFFRLATNQVLLDGIEKLKAQDEMSARILQLRFPDNNSLLMVANNLNVSEHTVSRLQRAAIEQLAHVIYEQEQAMRAYQGQKLEAGLPPASYSQLFGLKEAQTELYEKLRSAPPWVTAIVGIGGIGKTALADSLVRRVIPEFRFDDVIWLRVEYAALSGQSLSPNLTYEHLLTDLARRFWPDAVADLSFADMQTRVRQRLKAQPYLIVIDNLENQTDASFLQGHLHDLAQPTKFLITTRTRPTESAQVFSYTVDELPFADAANLMRHHAAEIGLTAFAQATQTDIRSIYSVTGGNPLAIKLVISLLDVLSLPQVLEALMHGRSQPTSDMYKHIYWQTWHTLSPKAQVLLQAMPLVSEIGGMSEYLQTISGLSDTELWPALQELRARSLLEVHGSLQEKRYGIHRLTETFLHTEIIHWPADNG